MTDHRSGRNGWSSDSEGHCSERPAAARYRWCLPSLGPESSARSGHSSSCDMSDRTCLVLATTWDTHWKQATSHLRHAVTSFWTVSCVENTWIMIRVIRLTLGGKHPISCCRQSQTSARLLTHTHGKQMTFDPDTCGPQTHIVFAK